MEEVIVIKWKRLHPEAEIPAFKHEGDSGVDLKVVEDTVVPPMGRRLLRTGLAVEIPRGYEIQIRPRSGISLNTPIMIANSPGTIDSGYRGEIGIIVFNASNEPFSIKKGTRIAQAVVMHVPEVKHVETHALSVTGRNEKGFGSTGL